jgi:hypothetical protein
VLAHAGMAPHAGVTLLLGDAAHWCTFPGARSEQSALRAE